MIKKITYETCTEPGPFVGIPLYHVFLDKVSTSSEEIADALIAIRSSAQSKVVLLTGNLDPVYSNEMFTFLKTLKDSNYNVTMIVDSKLFYSYFGLLNWLTIKVTLNPWAGFKCSQIIFDNFKDGDPEPAIFDESKTPPLCYVRPGDQKLWTKNGLIKFLTDAKFVWNVALPVSMAFSEIIYERTIKE